MFFGILFCVLGFLFLVGILQRVLKRRDDQIAPVMVGGSGETSSDEPLTPEAAEIAYGPVACAAQLYGLSQKERQAVLEQVFCQTCTHKECKDERTEEEQEDTVINVDIDTRCACAICLREYGMWFAIRL